MSEVGTWALAEDGTLTVTVTGVLTAKVLSPNMTSRLKSPLLSAMIR